MSFDLPATAVFVVITLFTPGPNNILCASMGALYGYRRTVPFMLGVASGFLVLMALCATLSSLLLDRFPAVAEAMRLIGGLYILYLAYGIYRGSAKLLEAPGEASPLGYWNALTLQLVNPKGIFFGLALCTTFLAPLLDDRWALLGVTVILAAVCFVAVSAWTLTGRMIHGWVKTPQRARAVGFILAVALTYTAVDLSGVLP